MKYLFIAFLFISSISYGQGIEPSSFQPTPYLGGVLRGVTPFVDEFTGQTYYLYVHDSLDAAVPYVDTIFMTDFNLYYIKNGDTIYVGSVTDSSFIYNVVSDTFALDMDIDSTNELQELFHQDNILVLTGAGPDSQVDLTPYMDVDSIYMQNYNLWYTKSGESGTPRFVGNVTDSSYIHTVVSDSIAAIVFPSDSTLVENDYGTIIVESPANTFGVTVDSSLYATTYDMTLKENYITPGTTSQYWRGDKTWQTTPTGTVTGSGTATRIAFWDGASSLSSNANLYWKNSNNRLSINSGASPVAELDVLGTIQLQNSAGSIFIGNLAGNNTGTGVLNTGVGLLPLRSITTGQYNTAIGPYTLFSNLSGSSNVSIGNLSMYSNLSGTDNIGIGTSALYTTTAGVENVAIGRRSLYQNTGNYNSAIGTASLYAASSGSNNTGIGYAAGYSNTGTGSVFIGFQSGFSETGSGKLYISNSTTASPLIGGNFSSGRVGINTAVASLTDALHVTGNIRGTAAYIDATNSAGTSGQVLSSTVTGTDWIDLPAGDITAVTVSAPVTGGGTSGSVNIAVDTTDATAAALATQFDLLGKQATLVSGTNIKTVNSNSLVGSGNVSVGTVQSITVNAPLTTTQAPITTTATLGVDTTASTPSALATQHDISSKVSGSGTDNYIPRFNGTTAIENSIMYDDGTNIGIGTASPTAKLSVAGALKVTGSTSGNTRIWGYDHTDGTMGIITIGSGLSLSGDALSASSAYDYWRISAAGGTAYAVTDDALIDFANGTGITWSRSGGVMTATNTGVTSLTGTTGVGVSASTGAVTLSLNNDLLALEGLASTGIAARTASNTWAQRTITSGTGISIVNGNGVSGNPTITNNGVVSLAGTAPITVSSATGAITVGLNFGSGLALSGSQLQTTPVIMAFLNHSSGGYTANFTAGETKKVDFTTALSNSSITTDVSTNENITINSAGTYEINYNVCISSPTNFDEPTLSLYINGSQNATTVKSIWLTVAGQKQCISGTHVMALSSTNTVDMRVSHPQAQTGAGIIAPQLKVQKLF